MRARLWLLMVPLLAAALACGLTSNESEDPTDIPTQGVIGQVATVAQAVPTSSPRPSSTPAPTLEPTPSCSIRTDWPTVTVAQGETLFSIAQRTGSSVTELTAANCLQNANAIQTGQQLHVPAAIPPTVVSGSTTGGSTTGGTTGGSGATGSCSNTYFFSFNTNVSETRCPGTVISGNAAGQDFEGGRVLWYQAAGIYSQPVLYVIYNDGTWAQYTDTWDSSQPFDDPSIIPPTDRFAPVAGIGKMWREAPGVARQTRLGLGGRAALHRGRRQEPILASNSNVFDIYIDHGVRGLVLQIRRQLVGSAQTWIVAGGYN